MKALWVLSVTLFTFSLICGTSWAAGSSSTQGLLTSVTGKVQIKNANGKKSRMAQKNSTVLVGERVVTDNGSKATLQLFDGSEVEVSPNTDFQLSKMQQPNPQDKILQFKLFLGQLFAKVKKLASAKSSFEIEAGGVVCGVRGTQYSYSYDPNKHIVTVHVNEGTVFVNANGQTYLFTSGQTATFTNGKPGPNNPDRIPASGKQGDTAATISLADLDQQFGSSVTFNGDNNLTSPNVAGSSRLNVNVNVSPPETVP